jgi:hypothetical protein
MAIRFGGAGSVATASNSWVGTNRFGVGPIDHAGNWHS